MKRVLRYYALTLGVILILTVIAVLGGFASTETGALILLSFAFWLGVLVLPYLGVLAVRGFAQKEKHAKEQPTPVEPVKTATEYYDFRNDEALLRELCTYRQITPEQNPSLLNPNPKEP